MLLTALVFVDHVRRGFFVADDWFYNAVARFGGHAMGLPHGGTVAALFDVFPDRPTLPFVFGAMHKAFGLHMKLYVATAVGAGLAMAVLLYVLLRMLRIERVHSFAIAALALLFPFADAPRLWTTGLQASLAVILFLTGLIVAVLGLRTSGRRAVALHIAAIALYLLSIMTYQLTFGLVLASGLVYLAEMPCRAALYRWGADVGTIVVGGSIAISRTAKSHGIHLHRLEHVYRTAFDLLPAAATGKASSIGATAFALVLLGIPALTALAAWRLRDMELRRWTIVAGVGIVMAAAGYLALVPAKSYNALDVGIGNRVNLAASLGMVTLVYADLVLISLVVMRGPLRPLRLVPVLIVAVMIGLGYHSTLAEHERNYHQAYNIERIVIGSMTALRAQPPPSGTMLYVVGHPFYVNGVPVFSRTSDTRAVAKIFVNPSFQAAPLAGLAKLVCRRVDVYPPAWGLGAQAPYGRAIVVESFSHRATRLTSRSVCLHGKFPLTAVAG